jgi:hypothetical protein
MGSHLRTTDHTRILCEPAYLVSYAVLVEGII